MDNNIYIICEEKTTKDGIINYIPIVEITDDSTWDLIACNDLIALQKENAEFLSEKFYEEVDIIIIPTTLEQYQKIRNKFQEDIKQVKQKIIEATTSMKEAFNAIGRTFESDEYIAKQIRSLDVTKAVFCFDERLIIGEQRDDYEEKISELPFSMEAQGSVEEFDSYLTDTDTEF